MINFIIPKFKKNDEKHKNHIFFSIKIIFFPYLYNQSKGLLKTIQIKKKHWNRTKIDVAMVFERFITKSEKQRIFFSLWGKMKISLPNYRKYLIFSWPWGSLESIGTLIFSETDFFFINPPSSRTIDLKEAISGYFDPTKRGVSSSL